MIQSCYTIDFTQGIASTAFVPIKHLLFTVTARNLVAYHHHYAIMDKETF